MTTPLEVLVLGGGPDAEREVSLVSSRAVFEALDASAGCKAHYQVIDRVSGAQLAEMPGRVIFPVLHGGFGEGGPLQDLLVADGRPFVGCGPSAARLAMDKLATKVAAARAGIPTLPCAVFNGADGGCPLPLPVVVKPVHEGSSVGVHFCHSEEEWSRAHANVLADQAIHPRRAYLIERALLGGRELTVGLLDGTALAPIEIRPAVAFYDYQAKYHSDETKYVPDPTLPAGVRDRIGSWSELLFRELGCRHLARADFILDAQGQAWLLEINTMPGFTGHSLLPMAAAHAGISFEGLARRLVDLAIRDFPARAHKD
ncbi:MAG: D-alanine--D-alanine ligase family protein [Phycisphaerales bacterium]